MKKGWLIPLLCLLLCCVYAAAAADEDFLIDNRKPALFEGETLQLNLLRQGNALLDGELTWVSSNQRVVTVSPDGLITGQAKGTATVTATLKIGNRQYRSSASVTVQRAVTGITVNENSLTVVKRSNAKVKDLLTMESDLPVLLLYAGQNVGIRATVTPKDASNTAVTYTSDDEDVLKISQGNLRPLKAGETILTVASALNPEVQKQYHVFVAQYVKKITVTAPRKAIAVGGEMLLSAQIEPADATWQDVTWSSVTPRTVSVDARGKVTGLAKGEARIRATANDGSKRTGEIAFRVEQMPTDITVNETHLTVYAEDDPLVADLMEVNMELPVLVLYLGETAPAINATVYPENATNRNYKLFTEDELVVRTINNGRQLQAMAIGETLLTVACDADNSVCTQYHLIVARHAQKVSVQARSTSISVGGKTQVTAAVTPADTTWKDVTWSSRTPNVLSVNERGVVTGLARGEGRIRATANDGSGRYGEVTIQVAQLPTSVSVSGHSTVVAGRSVNLTANVQPNNANNKKVTWSSSNNNVATVSAGGRVTGVRAGTVTITCTCEADGTVFAAWPMTVVQLVDSIAFTAKEVTINVNEKARVFWTVSPNTATDKSVTLTSNNTKVATVDQDGTIHAWKRGECTITAKANDGSNKTGRIKVVVLQPVWGVHMRNDTVTVGVDETVTLQAELEPSDASNRRMTWTIADPYLATITGNNNRPSVRGHAWGMTTATGVTEDGGFVTTCTIRVGSYNKALRITDLYLQSNQIKIVIKNLSNLNITRFYFTLYTFDVNDQPLVCSVNGIDNFISGYYLETLYEGDTTSHGRFRFNNFAQPTEPIGRVRLVLTGYTCDDGFAYTYHAGSQPWLEFTSPNWVSPTPEPTPVPEVTPEPEQPQQP